MSFDSFEKIKDQAGQMNRSCKLNLSSAVLSIVMLNDFGCFSMDLLSIGRKYSCSVTWNVIVCEMILKDCQFCCYQGLNSAFKSYLFLLRQIFDNGAIQCGRNGARLKADLEIMTRHKKDDSKIIGRISWHQSFEICNIKIFAAHNQQSSDTLTSECLKTDQ